MRYLTEDAVDRFRAAGIQPGFDHDLWPLLHRDALWAYYSTLARSQPAAIKDPAQFLADLEDALQPHAHTTANWEVEVGNVVEKHVVASRRLNLRGGSRRRSLGGPSLPAASWTPPSRPTLMMMPDDQHWARRTLSRWRSVPSTPGGRSSNP